MAGIIDIRKNIKTGRWVARPRFAWDMETIRNGVPSADGIDPEMALYNLSDFMPEDMANQIRLHCHRSYRSPEYVWMYDRCMEMDGHCPRREEWAKRRADFLLDCKLGNEAKYGVIKY